MNINDLLTRYFEGDTTCEEERELKRFFREEELSPELEVYRPFFAFFEEETYQQTEKQNTRTKHTGTIKYRRYFMYTLGGIAAGMLLILGITGITNQINQPANYVIIDGHKSADIQLARQQAQAAFSDVSFSREDVFETLFSE